MSLSSQGTFVPSVFQFGSQAVRIFVNDQGEPWFCATDVCAVLGYQNAPDAIAKHCRQKGIAKRDTFTRQGQQSLTFIDEGNLYRLIIKSRLPAAEHFEAWVCDEVLPTIRKTGSYDQRSFNFQQALTENLSTLHIPIPEELHQHINQKAWSMTQEVYELIRDHLQRQIAYSCVSNIGQLQVQKAHATIDQCNLGKALIQRRYQALEQLIIKAELAKAWSEKLLNELAKDSQK